MKKINKESIVQKAVGEYGYKDTSKYEDRVCPECKQPYRRFSGEVEYIYDGLKFCTFPCKNKYRKRVNPENLSKAEIMIIKIREEKEKQRQRARKNRNKKKE